MGERADGDVKAEFVDRLDANELTRDFRIKVDVKQHVVALSSRVGSSLAKRAAGDDAWDTPDVVDVSNQLVVEGSEAGDEPLPKPLGRRRVGHREGYISTARNRPGARDHQHETACILNPGQGRGHLADEQLGEVSAAVVEGPTRSKAMAAAAGHAEPRALLHSLPYKLVSPALAFNRVRRAARSAASPKVDL